MLFYFSPTWQVVSRTPTQEAWIEYEIDARIVKIAELLTKEASDKRDAKAKPPQPAVSMDILVANFIEKNLNCPDFLSFPKSTQLNFVTSQGWPAKALAIGARKSVSNMMREALTTTQLEEFRSDLEKEGVSDVMESLFELHHERHIVAFLGPVVAKVNIQEGGIEKNIYVSYPLVRRFEGLKLNEI